MANLTCVSNAATQVATKDMLCKNLHKEVLSQNYSYWLSFRRLDELLQNNYRSLVHHDMTITDFYLTMGPQ